MTKLKSEKFNLKELNQYASLTVLIALFVTIPLTFCGVNVLLIYVALSPLFTKHPNLGLSKSLLVSLPVGGAAIITSIAIQMLFDVHTIEKWYEHGIALTLAMLMFWLCENISKLLTERTKEGLSSKESFWVSRTISIFILVISFSFVLKINNTELNNVIDELQSVKSSIATIAGVEVKDNNVYIYALSTKDTPKASFIKLPLNLDTLHVDTHRAFTCIYDDCQFAHQTKFLASFSDMVTNEYSVFSGTLGFMWGYFWLRLLFLFCLMALLIPTKRYGTTICIVINIIVIANTAYFVNSRESIYPSYIDGEPVSKIFYRLEEK